MHKVFYSDFYNIKQIYNENFLLMFGTKNVFNVKLVENYFLRWWWSMRSATVSLSGAARFSAKDVVVKSNTIPANNYLE